jgi:hypothetical protein
MHGDGRIHQHMSYNPPRIDHVGMSKACTAVIMLWCQPICYEIVSNSESLNIRFLKQYVTLRAMGAMVSSTALTVRSSHVPTTGFARGVCYGGLDQQDVGTHLPK